MTFSRRSYQSSVSGFFFFNSFFSFGANFSVHVSWLAPECCFGKHFYSLVKKKGGGTKYPADLLCAGPPPRVKITPDRGRQKQIKNIFRFLLVSLANLMMNRAVNPHPSIHQRKGERAIQSVCIIGWRRWRFSSSRKSHPICKKKNTQTERKDIFWGSSFFGPFSNEGDFNEPHTVIFSDRFYPFPLTNETKETIGKFDQKNRDFPKRLFIFFWSVTTAVGRSLIDPSLS